MLTLLSGKDIWSPNHPRHKHSTRLMQTGGGVRGGQNRKKPSLQENEIDWLKVLQGWVNCRCSGNKLSYFCAYTDLLTKQSVELASRLQQAARTCQTNKLIYIKKFHNKINPTKTGPIPLLIREACERDESAWIWSSHAIISMLGKKILWFSSIGKSFYAYMKFMTHGLGEKEIAIFVWIRDNKSNEL